MRLYRSAMAVLAVHAALSTGCGGGDDAGSGIDPNGPEVTALKDSLEGWKGKLVKRCSVADAFPEMSDEDALDTSPMLDSALFLQKVGGPLAIEGASGEFVWLGTPETPTGTSVSTSASQSSVTTSVSDRDGKKTESSSSAVEVKLERDGARCRVFINGEQVHETRLYAGVPVEAHANAAKLAGLPAVRAETLTVASSKPGSEPLAFVGADNLFAAFQAALAPTAASADFLASHFGISTEEASVVFRPRPLLQLPAVLELSAPRDVLPATLSTGRERTLLIGPKSNLEGLGVAGTHTLEFTLLVQPGRTSMDAEPAGELLTANGALTLEVQAPRPGALVYVPKLTRLESGPVRARSPEAAVACLQKRLPAAQVYSADVLALDAARTLSPLAGLVWGGCELHSTDWKRASLADAATRKAFVDILESSAVTTPSPLYSFAGWDAWLEDTALLALEQGLELRPTFAPQDGTVVDRFIEEADGLLLGVKDEGLRARLRASLLGVAFAWTFRGAPVPAQRPQLTEAINRHGVLLEGPTRSLIEDVAAGGSTATAALSCAASFDEARVKQFLAVRDAARGSAAEAELTDREKRLFSLCPAAEVLANWAVTVDALKAFEAAEVQRSPKLGFSSSLEEFIGRALDQAWTSRTLETFSQVASIVPSLQQTCSLYSTATERADCGGADAFSAATGKLLAPEFEGRYGMLAEQLSAHLSGLQDTAIGTLFELQDGFLDSTPMWSRCNATDFASRSKQLVDMVKKLGASEPGLDSFLLEPKVRDLIESDC